MYDEALSIVNIETHRQQHSYSACSLQETELIGQKIAKQLTFPSCVYLQGEMGAGKTTLSKSIIQAFGYVGAVTSPTYNLVQEYQVGQGVIYHMDLYRLEDPSELEYLALDDLWSNTSLFLIEWPVRGAGYLQMANAEVNISKALDAVDQRNIVLTV